MWFESGVTSGNTERIIGDCDMSEASFAHHLRKSVLSWKGSDRFNQISIGIFICSDKGANAGNDIEGIGIVKRC